MSGVAVVRSLLAGNSTLTATVAAANIVAGPLPEGSPTPAISVMEIASTEVPHYDAFSPTVIVDALVQVTILAASYQVLKSVHALARKACNYQRGSIDGFTVISVRRVSNGPDVSDVKAKFFTQTLDLSVLYHEPN